MDDIARDKSTCPGCMWKCKCDLRCFKCQIVHNMSCAYFSWTNWEFDPPRNKFVCFKCKHIWKSPWTKNMYAEFPKSQRIRICNGEKQPTCNKCGSQGLKVGSTFRHCKTDKAWKELEDKVNNREIDLINEFTFCPMNNRIKWTDVYPEVKDKKWNDTRRNKKEEGKNNDIEEREPIIPRPYYTKNTAKLNVLGQTFLPLLSL